jgi:histidinol-phosphatase
MPMRDFNSDLQVALGLADLADEMSMDVFNAGSFGHSIKSDGTPSIPIEEAIEGEFRHVLIHDRPADGFLGEESGQSGDLATCWIVDPIDGTREFIAGDMAWGTQIALRVNGELTLGVTSAPALRSRWWGGVGHGAWASESQSGERALEVFTGDNQRRLRWSCHPPVDVINDDWRRLASRLQDIGDYVVPNRHAVLMVLEGQTEVALQLEGAPWDYAAFAAIIRAAGGRFSYLDSSTVLEGVRPALFTNGLAHDDAIKSLA